jgi:hypothetical protein
MWGTAERLILTNYKLYNRQLNADTLCVVQDN